MFRNIVKFADIDINNLVPVNDLSFEKDSLGRPVGMQAVDQFDSQPFMMAENGFKRSDVSILMKAESDDLKLAVASRITEIKDSGQDLSGLSDSDLARLTVPRYVNSAASFRDWAASLDKGSFAKSVDSFIEAQKAKVVSNESSENRIDFTKESE